MRKAKAILLTDYHLNITLHGHELFTIDPFDGVNDFIVSGRDISRILEAAGVTPRRVEMLSRKNRDYEYLSNLAFKIGQEIRPFQVAEGFNVTDLEVDVMAANLVNIKIYYQSEQSETENFTEEITYSGRFLIEWQGAKV
jgi:hypothetical protein